MHRLLAFLGIVGLLTFGLLAPAGAQPLGQGEFVGRLSPEPLTLVITVAMTAGALATAMSMAMAGVTRRMDAERKQAQSPRLEMRALVADSRREEAAGSEDRRAQRSSAHEADRVAELA